MFLACLVTSSDIAGSERSDNVKKYSKPSFTREH